MESANSAFSAGIHIRGRFVKEVHHRGRTYIEGRKGSKYTLHFENGTHKRVLVIPSVDGLSVVDGKPAGRNSAGFIVERNSILDVPGWIVDGDTAAQFVFWPQDARGTQTYVEALEKEGANVDLGNQGMIGFLVLDEHFTPTLTVRGQLLPKDADIFGAAGFDTSGMRGDTHRGIACASGGTSVSMMSSSTPVSATLDSFQIEQQDETGMGTKFGEATDFHTRAVNDFKRGRTLGEFVFEYDTIRGLKDRGVPVEMFKSSKRSGYAKWSRSAFPADSTVRCKTPDGWQSNRNRKSR